MNSENKTLIFDIDQTLLPPDESLKDDPELLKVLDDFLSQGVQICLISGGPGAVVRDRITGHLKSCENLTIYANGGSSCFTLNDEGECIADDAFEESNQISADILEAVRAYLEKQLKAGFDLEASEFADMYEKCKELRDKQWVDKDIQFDDQLGPDWKLDLLEDLEMAHVKSGKGRARTSFPFINTRGSQFNSDGTRKSVLGLTPTGFYRDGDNDFRDTIIEKLKRDLSEVADNLTIYKAGRSSIDIVKKGADKAAALMHFVQKHRLDGKNVLYFGDEFYEGGNDYVIMQDSVVKQAGVQILACNIVDPKNAELNWIGSGPKAVLDYLRKLSR